MNCQNYVFDEDGERVCECGDEGRMCRACSEETAAYWRSLFDASRGRCVTEEEYREEMRDAGRGHLLGEL